MLHSTQLTGISLAMQKPRSVPLLTHNGAKCVSGCSNSEQKFLKMLSLCSFLLQNMSRVVACLQNIFVIFLEIIIDSVFTQHGRCCLNLVSRQFKSRACNTNSKLNIPLWSCIYLKNRIFSLSSERKKSAPSDIKCMHLV